MWGCPLARRNDHKMTEYYLKGAPGITHDGLAYAPGNDIKLSIKINIPNLILERGCVDVNNKEMIVPGTGFAVNDILHIAAIPEGFVVDFCECYVHTVNAEMEAGSAINIESLSGLYAGIALDELGSSFETDLEYAAKTHFCANGSYISIIPVLTAVLQAVFTVSFHAYRLRPSLVTE